MAVKIEQIDDLEELSTKLTEYSTSMKTTGTKAQVTFTDKLEGSENEAVVAFVEVMNELKSNAFAHLPETTDTFVKALETYHSALKDAGFNNLIKSVKPTVEGEYCEEVTSTEYQKAEEKALDIKDVINEISRSLPEVPTSQINSLLEELGTALKTKTEDIKKTRSKVQRAQKNFKSQLNEVMTQLNQCTQALDNIMNMTDPKAGLKPQNFVQLIQQGAGPTVSKGNLNKDEIKALNCLIEKKYDDLFALDPNNLSDQVHGILVNSIINQVTLGKDAPEDLNNMLNSLLKQSGEGAGERVRVYLEKFSEQTVLQFEQLSTILALDASDPELAARYEKVRAVDNLFETLYVLRTNKRQWEDLGLGSHWVDYYSTIDTLSFDEEGKVSFDLTNYKTIYGSNLSEKTKKMDSIRYDGVSDFSKAEDKQKLAELRAKKAQFIHDVLATSVSVGLGIFAPEVAGAIGIIGAISSAAETKGGSLKQVKEINEAFDQGIIDYQEKKFENDKAGFSAWKEAYKKSRNTKLRSGAGDIMGGIADLWASWEQMTKEIDEAGMKCVYDIVDIGGLVIIEDHTIIHTALTPIEKMTYEQQIRFYDFTENGYQSFFNELNESDADRITIALAAIKKDYPNLEPVVNFIQNGGDITKVNIDQIQNVLENAIKSSGIDNKRELREEAVKWFMDPSNK
jgi:hypothetical protein